MSATVVNCNSKSLALDILILRCETLLNKLFEFVGFIFLFPFSCCPSVRDFLCSDTERTWSLLTLATR